MSALRKDPYPLYKAVGRYPNMKSGVSMQSDNNTSRHCVHPELYMNNRPSTPKEIKRFRKSHMQQVGTTIVHPGKALDQLPPYTHTYGIGDNSSLHVLDCLKVEEGEGFKSKLNNFKEEIYLSRKKEPLGKKMEYNYQFPEECQANNFKFGVPTEWSETTAKHLLHSGVGMYEPKEIEKMYKKTHGATRPGEQTDREYNWPFDKNKHSFGKTYINENNQTKMCLQPEFSE